MHFLNWYTAMWSPRLRLPPLSRGARGDRTGHFWEKRYFCDGFHPSDKERALNTLRYIHGNPKAAKIRSTFFYDFSNYGSYERLTDDGLTQWHPAFLKLGDSLEECASAKAFARSTSQRRRTPLSDNPGEVSYWHGFISLNLSLLTLVIQGKGEPRRETTSAPLLPCFSTDARYPKPPN
jgi:hypothetical protein